MASNPNFGGEFWLSNSSALQRVFGVLSVGFPNPQRGTYRTTNHESEGAHTYKGEELVEPGTFTVRIQYDPDSATDELLIDALTDINPRAYKRVFPMSGGSAQRQIDGEAVLTSYEPQEQTMEGQQEAVLTFQASGTAAASNV